MKINWTLSEINLKWNDPQAGNCVCLQKSNLFTVLDSSSYLTSYKRSIDIAKNFKLLCFQLLKHRNLTATRILKMMSFTIKIYTVCVITKSKKKIMIMVPCSGRCCDGFKLDKMSNTCIGIFAPCNYLSKS